MDFNLPEKQKQIADRVTNCVAGRSQTLCKGRRNLGLVIATINYLIADRKRGGHNVLANEVARMIVDFGWDNQWELSPTSNGTGLAKAVGDCMGDHPDGLRLPKARYGSGYSRRLPTEPIDDEWLYQHGIDPASCDHPILHK